jgi:hypothetical protein
MFKAASPRRALTLAALLLLVGVLLPGVAATAPQPLPTDAKVLFVHHSVGGVIWDGGVPEWFDAYNAAHATNYTITQVAYPDTPYPWDNYPYDYWNLWVNHAGTVAYQGQSTLEMLTQQYDVIVFKHCFPASNIEPDAGAADVTSSVRTLANYKAQYAALKTKLHSFPANRFIVWTGAAKLQSEISVDMATRAHEFFSWVVNDWDESDDNIYVWDFYSLETEGGLYLTTANGSSDSHPNATFAAAVAPQFCERVVKVIEGLGDTPDSADVPGSDDAALALAGANPATGPVTLRLSLPAAGRVQLAIFDPAGRRVALLADDDSPAGQRTLVWNHHADGAGPGVYFARLRAGGRDVTRRFVVLD